MDITYIIISLIIGLLIGAVITYIILKNSQANNPDTARIEFEGERKVFQTKLEGVQEQLQEEKKRGNDYNVQINELNVQIQNISNDKSALETKLQNEIENSQEKLEMITQAQEAFKDSFASLSKKALNDNNTSFINQAEQVLKSYQENAQTDLKQRQEKISEIIDPVQKQLEKVDSFVREVERERGEAYVGLREQIEHISNSHAKLNDTTSHLVNVLSNTKSRGQWGEIQLRRVVELAGMINYCDFNEQVHINTENGRYLPDMVVNLPSDRVIVVDAKAPMNAFLDAHEATDEESRKGHFLRHAKSLRSHVASLKTKSYQNNFEHTPEFVLLFLPNEAIYSAALEQDPSLLEDGIKDNVIIATPSTLIALLKAAAFGWRQSKMVDEMKEFSDLGRELYERFATVTEHIEKLGKSINGSVENYNKLVGSVERRLIPSAKKFRELNVIGDVSKEVEDIKEIDKFTRMPDFDIDDFEEIDKQILELESKDNS